MRKNLLTTVCILFTAFSFSQVKLEPGIKFGGNFSKISDTNLDTKTGLYAGVLLNIQFSDFYALQPEITYSGQGGKSNLPNVEDLNINYVTVGLANKLFFSPKVGLHVIAGASVDIDFDNNFINLVNDVDNDSDIRPIDLAVFGGLGYDFDFGLSLEIRYKQGLLDTSDSLLFDIFTDDNEDDTLKLNSVVQIGIAYRFKL